MSTAWKGSAVLLREPTSAFWSRLGYRAAMAGAFILVGVLVGVPWVSVVMFVLAVPFLLLAVAAVVNILRNKRALLVHTGAGSIEWPQSLQEQVLRRPLEWVAGKRIEVTVPPIEALPGKLDPRVSLSDGERVITRVPLYGVAPEDFVAAANAVLAGRGTTLVFAPPVVEDDDAPELPDAGAAE
ncbi:hypothetical protein [Demequina sp.]|uniref:hypothetical protein n=1 Tax=Demequina sp. TaxID=2050685 RepID=UPI003D12BB9A